MTWAPKPLSEILDQSGRHRAGDQDLPVLSITMKHGLVDQADKFKKRVASLDTSNYRIAYKNELVVGFPIDEGVLGFQTRHLAGIVSPAYDIWKLKSEAECHIPYLERYLRSPQARSLYASRMQGAVARRRSLTKADFLKLEIPFPSIDDQIRIAHLLGKVDGLITQRKQRLQQLDDLLQSVFLEMFGDPVRNDKGWDTIPFHKIGHFVSGGTPSKSRNDFWNGSFPWVSPKDMKVAKIAGAADYISETVFEETTLKRIAPGHLLIVVRGMILAHSFPVAINAVEIAINQDMKAIKPIKGMSVIYLQNCLVSLKRQILKLISTAGHGTRKFDAIAMQKLFIPMPPVNLQNQFAAIVEKVADLKSRYQQSLTDLEALYGALSQQAFKGELDLSRVPLPTMQSEEEQPMAIEPLSQHTEEIAINLPDTELLLTALENPEQRAALLSQWLEAYRGQLGEVPFSLARFIAAAQTRLSELHPDADFELGSDDYEHIKAWTFEALATGKLMQVLDDDENLIKLRKRSDQWGSW